MALTFVHENSAEKSKQKQFKSCLPTMFSTRKPKGPIGDLTRCAYKPVEVIVQNFQY